MGRLNPRHIKEKNNLQNTTFRFNYKAKKSTKAKEIYNFHKAKFSENHETSSVQNFQTHETSSDSIKM